MDSPHYPPTPYRRLQLSYDGSAVGPEWSYRKLGFVPTGEVEDGEIYAALPL